MNNYYVTFSRHSAFKNQVLKLSATSYKEAIKTVKETIGNAWDTIYSEEDYNRLLSMKNKNGSF